MKKMFPILIVLLAAVVIVVAVMAKKPDQTMTSQTSTTPTSQSLSLLPGQAVPTDSTETVSGEKLSDGSYKIAYNGHTISIKIGDETDVTKSGEALQQWPVTFSDELGHTQSFVRSYHVITGSSSRITDSEPAVYLDNRTYEYVSSNDQGDPLRHTLEFSGKGLYVWVYQGLYYYDPATGTFGLDMDMIP